METAARTAGPSSATAGGLRSPVGHPPADMADTAVTTTDANRHESMELDDMSPASPTRQDKTPLQYTEFDPHAAPEVVVFSGAVGGDGSAAGQDAVARPAGSVFWDRLRGRRHALATAQQHDGSDEDGKHGPDNQDAVQRGPVVVALARRPWCTWAWWAGCLPRAWRWGREKPYLAAAAASLFIGVLALIILPIVLHGMSLNGASGPPGPTTTTTTASAVSSASSSSTATSTSIAGTIPALCKSNATWATNVSFMGIAVAGATSWPYKLLPSTSAVDCCTTCYAHFDGGCQGWSFLPWDNTPVPCTILYGWNTTDGVTSACPNGRAPIVFASDPDRVDSVGSPGPCGVTSTS